MRPVCCERVRLRCGSLWAGGSLGAGGGRSVTAPAASEGLPPSGLSQVA